MITNTEKRKLSLKTQCLISIICVIWGIGILGILTMYRFSKSLIDNYYSQMIHDLTKTLAISLDINEIKDLKNEIEAIYDTIDEPIRSYDWGSDAFNAYIDKYKGIDTMPTFLAIQNKLRAYQDVNDVDCIYLSFVDPSKANMIYIIDGAYEDACPPGCVDPIYEVNKKLLTDPTIGFPPYITNTGYGWLITAGAPIYDENNEVIAYAMADISMENIKKEQIQYIIWITIALIMISIIVSIISIKLINKYIIRPIQMLSATAQAYCDEGDQNNAQSHKFDQLRIDTNNELRQLLASIQKMEQTINDNIAKLSSTKNKLKETMITAEEMTIEAFTDALTGVKNKNAYTRDIQKIEQNHDTHLAILMCDVNNLKTINDTYGHEKGDIYLKGCCNLICQTFKHSAVYRTGGDEFVVILRRNDFTDRKIIIKKLKNHLEDIYTDNLLHAWMKYSIAIGLGTFENNNTLRAVIKEADKEMYENKKAFKQKYNIPNR